MQLCVCINFSVIFANIFNYKKLLSKSIITQQTCPYFCKNFQDTRLKTFFQTKNTRPCSFLFALFTQNHQVQSEKGHDRPQKTSSIIKKKKKKSSESTHNKDHFSIPSLSPHLTTYNYEKKLSKLPIPLKN